MSAVLPSGGYILHPRCHFIHIDHPVEIFRQTVIVGHGGASYQMSFFINKRDRHDQSNVSQEYYNQFVEDVAAGTNEYPTLFGYDGINKIVSDKGLISYTSGNEYEPMVTLFTLSESGVTVAHNQVLREWLG